MRACAAASPEQGVREREVSLPRGDAGLGDTPEPERPLEATLYGEPPLGRAGVRLADSTESAGTPAP